MKYLVIGLGNPGPEYAETRHNIGFQVVDTLAGEQDAAFRSVRHGDAAEISHRGRKLILLKPNTYMNLSGKAVAHHLQQDKLPLERLLIITDDIALPFGTIRLRAKGSDGGHNGLKDIQDKIGSKYPRLRVGVGGDFAPGQQVRYVLEPFSAEEIRELPTLREACAAAVKDWAFRGIQQAMTKHNGTVGH